MGVLTERLESKWGVAIFLTHLDIHNVGILGHCLLWAAGAKANAIYSLMSNELEKYMKSRKERK